MYKYFQLLILLLTSLLLVNKAIAGITLEEVIDRDEVICGVRGGSFGFGKINDKGVWSGLDVDFCRALAVAILKDPNKVQFLPLAASIRFTALQDNEVDVLMRNTTWTYSRDTSLGLEFAGINFYDSQGFIAWKEPGKKSIKDYAPDTKICMVKNTTSLVNLKDYLSNNNLHFNIIEFESTEAADNSFLAQRCDVYSNDRSILSAFINISKAFSKSLIILDETISKEPIGPSVRDDDSHWRELVQWTLYATIEAEEKGINSQNIDRIKRNSKNPAIRFLLGADPGVGKPLGLDDEWVYRIIKYIGNYEEIFHRNLGELGLERGANKLWNQGGLLYSPPFR